MSFLYSKHPVYVNPDVAKRDVLSNIAPSKTDVWLAAGREAFEDNPEQLLNNIVKVNYQKHVNTNKLSKLEFDEKYKDSGIEYDHNMSAELADYLLLRQQKRKVNEYIISRGKGGLVEAVGIFGSAVASSFLSPINIGLAFVPVAGEAKWGYIAAKYGKLAATAARGGVSSALFQSVFEPIVSYSRDLEQREYRITESLVNIGIAATFGASINALGYGIGKLKDKIVSQGQAIHRKYSSSNPVIDNELKTNLKETLKNTTYPESSSIENTEVGDNASLSSVSFNQTVAEDIPYLQKQKLDLYNRYKDKFPTFFKEEYEAAKLEQYLHEEFASCGREENIPDYLLNDLKAKQNNAANLKEQHQANPDYQTYLEAKAAIDTKITKRIKYEQSMACAYELSSESLYIAKSQLEDGKHIDLSDPTNAKSIYESGYETVKNTLAIDDAINPLFSSMHRENILSNCTNFVSNHISPKLGLKELLRQTELRQHTIANELTFSFTNELEKCDLIPFYQSKEFAGDIIRELSNLTMNNHLIRYTNSKQALEIAKIIHKHQTNALERVNRSGANIVKLKGYITRQSHSPSILKEMGYHTWKDFIVPLLDLERTGNIDLKSAYEGIVTGLHFNDIDGYISNSGTSNLANKISESRKLHFKSADAWLIYNEKCGKYNLAESVILDLLNLGHAIGILDVLGENPRNTLNGLKKIFLEDLRTIAAHGDDINGGSSNITSRAAKQAAKEMQYLQSSKFDNILDIMIGTSPENPTLAKVSSSIRAAKTMSSLGKTLISSIPDIAT